MGAQVCSFDYDPKSVACALELKKRYFTHDEEWIIERGDVLDKDYLRKLGRFDIVYSWGVLHHTGNMWLALKNIAVLVIPEGKIYISIYNDQGGASKRWAIVKKLYNHSSKPVKCLLISAMGSFFEGRSILLRLIRVGRKTTDQTPKVQENQRGMSKWFNLIDWVGGYPFEVAKPEHIFELYRDMGFILEKLRTCGGGHGCNEYVFKKATAS